jgi:hypothetical protein
MSEKESDDDQVPALVLDKPLTIKEWWPLIFINPLTIPVGGPIVWWFCTRTFVALYQPCPDATAAPTQNQIFMIGTVVSPEGETCRLEEVRRIDYDLGNSEGAVIDEMRHCRGAGKTERPLVRRIVCPSGLNGQSAVMDDGTKFHHEVLR